jgi:hypothetical protein
VRKCCDWNISWPRNRKCTTNRERQKWPNAKNGKSQKWPRVSQRNGLATMARERTKESKAARTGQPAQTSETTGYCVLVVFRNVWLCSRAETHGRRLPRRTSSCPSYSSLGLFRFRIESVSNKSSVRFRAVHCCWLKSSLCCCRAKAAATSSTWLGVEYMIKVRSFSLGVFDIASFIKAQKEQTEYGAK